MPDWDCVNFLQWALPQLQLRWTGFRRVRRQVCRRIQHRWQELELADLSAYRSYLETHPQEWLVLDACCRITISRFYRDKSTFDRLHQQVLPELAQRAIAHGVSQLCCWSAGCASGEEAYTLKIIWQLCLLPQFPQLSLRIIATDANTYLLKRAIAGCYESGSLKELPPAWRLAAFEQIGQQYCLLPDFKQGIQFYQQDIRQQLPDCDFQLVLCRNLVFTYFQPSLQQAVLQQIISRMLSGSVLVIGKHEMLPPGITQLSADTSILGVYHYSDTTDLFCPEGL